jgi:5'-deoxynucleotidase YfbR-like HD superfamily hydrolase
MLKNSELVKIIYPEPAKVPIAEIDIPTDISGYIDQLEKVVRFADVELDQPEMIDDNTKLHTIRCAYRAINVSFTHPDLVRTVWIHDIPEHAGHSDLSAVVRYKNPEKALAMEAKEKAVAKEVLQPEDFTLYESFSEAEDFLRREGKVVPKNQQAIVANTIDILDGNLVFAYYAAEWLKTHDYKKESFKREDYSYPLIMRKRFLKAVENTEVKKEVADAVRFLYQSYIKVTHRIWNEVPQDRIPEKMRPEILKMGSLSCC